MQQSKSYKSFSKCIFIKQKLDRFKSLLDYCKQSPFLLINILLYLNKTNFLTIQITTGSTKIKLIKRCDL